MNFVHKLQQDEEPALDAIGKLAQKDSTEATVSGRRPEQDWPSRSPPEMSRHFSATPNTAEKKPLNVILTQL